MRRWICSKEGFRRDKFLNIENREKKKKESKPIIRTGCQAALRVLRIKDTDGWIAKEFVPTHNHDLVSMAKLQMVQSNHECNVGIVAQVRTLNKVGIKTFQIVSHMVMQVGGYHKLPYQLWDVYNAVASERRKEKVKTYSEGALGYLDCLSTKDSNLCVECQIDDENRLVIFFA